MGLNAEILPPPPTEHPVDVLESRVKTMRHTMRPYRDLRCELRALRYAATMPGFPPLETPRSYELRATSVPETYGIAWAEGVIPDTSGPFETYDLDERIAEVQALLAVQRDRVADLDFNSLVHSATPVGQLLDPQLAGDDKRSQYMLIDIRNRLPELQKYVMAGAILSALCETGTDDEVADFRETYVNYVVNHPHLTDNQRALLRMAPEARVNVLEMEGSSPVLSMASLVQTGMELMYLGSHGDRVFVKRHDAETEEPCIMPLDGHFVPSVIVKNDRPMWRLSPCTLDPYARPSIYRDEPAIADIRLGEPVIHTAVYGF